MAPHRTGIVVLNSMQVASIPLEVGDWGKTEIIFRLRVQSDVIPVVVSGLK